MGERVIVESMRLNGRLIATDDTYRVTVNDFLAGGGDGFRVLREGRDAIGGPLDIEALTELRATRVARSTAAPGPLRRASCDAAERPRGSRTSLRFQ